MEQKQHNRSTEIKIGDRVRLVKADEDWPGFAKGIARYLDHEFEVNCKNRRVCHYGETCIRLAGLYYAPESWFEIIETAEEREKKQLKEVMDDVQKDEHVKNELFNLARTYHNGGCSESELCMSIRKLFVEELV